MYRAPQAARLSVAGSKQVVSLHLKRKDTRLKHGQVGESPVKQTNCDPVQGFLIEDQVILVCDSCRPFTVLVSRCASAGAINIQARLQQHLSLGSVLTPRRVVPQRVQTDDGGGDGGTDAGGRRLITHGGRCCFRALAA